TSGSEVVSEDHRKGRLVGDFGTRVARIPTAVELVRPGAAGMNALIGHRAAAVSGCTVEQSLSLPCLAGDKQGVYRVEQVLDGSLAVALGGCESSLERRTRKSPPLLCHERLE